MRIPINWLSDYVKLPNKLSDLTDKLTMVGHMLDKIEIKNGETILDLELRGNRADCYSILGIAREVSAIYGQKLKDLETINVKRQNKSTNLFLDVQTNLVKRVGIIEIKKIKIEKSPKWLADKLVAYGMETINNIVDLTNYVMIETGQPMHAFDSDKIGKNLEIRLARNGEKITTFQDTSLTLTKDDLVWAKSNNILSVAGSIGEKSHSISDSSKSILLEAASYDRANIRRTIYRHKLFTDAGIRHEKDLDPNMVSDAISRFLYFIKKYNWGEFKPIIYDYYPKKVNPLKIKLDYHYLINLSGVEIEKKEINKILTNLNFGDIDNVVIPTYRTDVILEEDLIEEIIRIYGYDKIPSKTLSLEIPKNITPDYIIQEEKIRQAAVSVGFDESISLSFVKEKYKNNNIELLNPPSPDNKYLRNTLFFNLLEATEKIINERGELVALFEIGKVYLKSKGKYLEKRKIGFIYWSKSKNKFIDFKSLISAFFEKSAIDKPNYISEILNFNFTNSYLLKLENDEIGYGGKHDDIYYLEIDLDSILGKEQKYKVNLWPKYPPQVEDITLEIPEKTYVGDVISQMTKQQPQVTRVELIDVFQRNYTFNIEYQDENKTLTDSEVKAIRTKILSSLKLKFGITIKE